MNKSVRKRTIQIQQWVKKTIIDNQLNKFRNLKFAEEDEVTLIYTLGGISMPEIS